MKSVSTKLEKCRMKVGPLASSSDFGNNGAFKVTAPNRVLLNVIASDGAGWEHVSVSTARARRCPTWEEMCFVKDLFWDEDEVVVQYHPAKSEYINCHPYTLHLWKQVGMEFPTPEPWMVGPEEMEVSA